MADDDIRETVNTETASAVVPPGGKPKGDRRLPDVEPVGPVEPEPDLSSDIEPSGPSIDAQQMAERGRQTAFRRETTGRVSGRPRAARAGGYVMTKDGWKLDKKVVSPKPGQPEVTFREGEGTTIKKAGGYSIGETDG